MQGRLAGPGERILGGEAGNREVGEGYGRLLPSPSLNPLLRPTLPCTSSLTPLLHHLDTVHDAQQSCGKLFIYGLDGGDCCAGDGNTARPAAGGKRRGATEDMLHHTP
ncbi:hypothetical protein E2C01_050121 [Portunus trituberculatus]|uniref:Uncharacterized protein n=1 Tax=Portunus trituberculatus TaxID=210409 RepID=A0A5B7GGF0_PORTR|nr:hypothetical protein [Portunus trituberculatus]